MARRLADPHARLTEAQWQQTIVEAAQLHGWWLYHTHDSRRRARGFPDLVLIRPPRIIFAELKTERGRMTPEQQHVMSLLNECSSAESYVWRPDDWPHVLSLLSRDGHPTVPSTPLTRSRPQPVRTHRHSTDSAGKFLVRESDPS